MMAKLTTVTKKRFRRAKDLWCEFGDKYPLNFNMEFAGAIFVSEKEFDEDETRVKLIRGSGTTANIISDYEYPCLKSWYGTIVEEYVEVVQMCEYF